MARPLEHSSRAIRRSTSGTQIKRSTSYVRPPEGSPDEDPMLKQMNLQLNEQRKAIAKVSKLCLGALTSIDQLETKVHKDGGHSQVILFS